jgi:hypothetical protein
MRRRFDDRPERGIATWMGRALLFARHRRTPKPTVAATAAVMLTQPRP